MDQDVSFNLIDEPWVRIRDEEGESSSFGCAHRR